MPAKRKAASKECTGRSLPGRIRDFLAIVQLSLISDGQKVDFHRAPG